MSRRGITGGGGGRVEGGSSSSMGGDRKKREDRSRGGGRGNGRVEEAGNETNTYREWAGGSEEGK